MKKNSFVIYTDCLEQLEVIPDADRGVLFLDVLKYARSGIVPNIDNPFLKALFLGFKNQIDRDCAKYEEVCRKRAEAGQKGGNQRVANLKQSQAIESNCKQDQANASNCKQMQAKASNTQANQADNDNESDNDNDNDIDIRKNKGKTSRFTPPSLQEVEEYIKENGYSFDAKVFFDHYESNGWVVGKTKMKDWKAAIRNWSRREKEYQRPSQKRNNNTNNVNDIWGNPNSEWK